jgi:hypothetical protein
VKVAAKKSKAKTTAVNNFLSAVDLEAQIRRRAYELYDRRGREAGYEVEDWLQAEAELAGESSQSLEGHPVKTNRKLSVTSTGKIETKQVKKVGLIGVE